MLLGALLLAAITVPAIAWEKFPVPETGCYYMYDDDAVPNQDYSVTFDTLPPLPVFVDLGPGTIYPDAMKLAPYNDRPFKYELPDSFYYFGQWYGPGCPRKYLYISPDGWVSFDPESEDGAPTPPATTTPFPEADSPNDIIAALWQDNNPTYTPEPQTNNRIYILHETWSDSNRLIIQWYKVKSNADPQREYDFELIMNLGGQDMLTEHTSKHHIDFLYRDCSQEWSSDGGVTGIEDYQGSKGVLYQGTIRDGRIVRAAPLLRCTCDCHKWDPVNVRIEYPSTTVAQGQTWKPVPFLVIVEYSYKCGMPPGRKCKQAYKWQVTGPSTAPGFPVKGGSNEPGTFSFTPTRRGLYTIHITSRCQEECEAFEFYIEFGPEWPLSP